MEETKKKKKLWFRILIGILITLAVFLAVLAGVFFYLRAKGEKKLSQTIAGETVGAVEEASVENDGKTVVYKGERYCYNEDVISILCLGIDRELSQTGTDQIGENGQADAVFLAVLNKKTGALSFLNISRETMVDINRYNVEGRFLGTERMQLCLSYAYGDGREKSCENTAEAVSRLLYGMPVHAYAAIDYSGIPVLNDAVGGITVEVLEDLTEKDQELEQGAVVMLHGEQAETYVRYRDTTVLDSNNFRMARQKQYLTTFLKQVLSGAGIGDILSLYQKAEDYMVTDIDLSQMAYLASLVLQNGIHDGTMVSIPGTVVKGEQYAEFVPDEEALYERVLELFYTKITE